MSFPPSHCPNCNTSLKPADLVPVLSYVLLGGKCRSCKNNISAVYPLIEGLNGLLYVLVYEAYGLSITTVIYCLVASALLTLAKIDLDTEIIPDRFHVIIGGLGVVLLIADFQWWSVFDSFIGFLVGGGFFLLLAIVSKGGMGGGDIKLMAALGFLLGWKSILMVTWIAFVVGAAISVILLVLKIKGRKEMIPFGPFISLAAFIVMLWGDRLITYYTSLMM